MSTVIKSFTAKIGSDTSDFIKGMNAVNREVKSMTSQATQLEKALAIKYNDKQFTQAQKLIQEALKETNEKADIVRKQLKKMEEAGNVDVDGYKKLNNELIKTESQATLLAERLSKISQLKTDRLTEGFKKVGKSVEGVGRSLMPLSAMAGAVGVGLFKSAKDTMQAADDIATSADKYTMSAKAIQYWQYISLQSDVPAERLFKASSKVRDAFGSQMTGEISKATETLDILGINIKNFDNSEDAFKATIESLSAMTDTTLQAKYANEIFGEKIATDLLPLFAQGEDAINQYNKEFESIGYMSDEQIKAFADLDNEFNKIKEQMKQTKYELGVALLPIIKEVSIFLTESVIPAVKNLVEWFSNLPEGTQKAIIGFVGILAVAAPLVIIIGKIIGGVGSIIKLLPLLSNAIKALGTTAGRAMIGIGALVAAVILISDVIKNWNNMDGLQRVISVLGILTTVALGAAVAFGAFHSAWSLGLAVAGIVAGIVAVTAAVNSSKNSIKDLNIPDFNAPNVTSNNSNLGGYTKEDLVAIDNLKNPYESSTNSNYENNTNNSVGDTYINIYVDKESTAQDIVDLASKELALRFATRR